MIVMLCETAWVRVPKHLKEHSGRVFRRWLRQIDVQARQLGLCANNIWHTPDGMCHIVFYPFDKILTSSAVM